MLAPITTACAPRRCMAPDSTAACAPPSARCDADFYVATGAPQWPGCFTNQHQMSRQQTNQRVESSVTSDATLIRRWPAMASDVSEIPGPAAPVDQWRDKKRYLWLMGLIAPTALFVVLPMVWTLNQLG